MPSLERTAQRKTPRTSERTVCPAPGQGAPTICQLLTETEHLSQTGACEWNLTTDRLTFSEGWRALYGFQKQTLTLRQFLRTVHPQDRSAVDLVLRRVRRGRGRCSLEHRIKPSNAGQERVLLMVAELVRDPRRRPVKLLAVVRDITEQRRAEEQLRTRESLLRAAFDNAPFEFWVRDKDRVCIMQNSVATQHWGNVVGRRPEDSALAPEAFAIWQANNRRAFAGEVVRGEMELHEPGGTRWMHNLVAPVRVDGKIQGVVGYNLDITELKKAEAALRASGAQATALMNAVTELFLLIGRDGTILTINPAMARRLHHRPRELIGKNVYALLPPEIGRRRKAWGDQVARSGQPLRFEDARDGIILDSHVYPAFDADGKVNALAIFAADITDRRRSDQLQREQLAQIDAIYQNAPVGLCLLDSEFRYLRVNKALATLNGVSIERHLGQTVRQVLPHLAEQTEAICRRVVATRRPLLNLELTGQTAAQPGETRTWMTHWSPVRLSDGKSTGINVIVQEVTEQKRAERLLREARDQLELRVKERTAELQAANWALHEALELNRSMIEASAVGIATFKASGDCIFANEALARITAVNREQIMRFNFRKLPSFQRSGLLPLVEAALADGKPRSGEAHACSSSGKEVWGYHHLIPFTLGGEPHLLHMVEDISAQKQSERFLIAQRDLAGFLSQTDDLAAALDRLMDAALQIPGVDCGGVYLRDAENGGFCIKAHRGLSAKFVQAAGFYPADSMGARLLHQGQPLYALPPELASRLSDLLRAEGMRGLAIVPLLDQTRLIGSFNFGSRGSPEIPLSSRAAVGALAALVVGAIVRIQTEQALHDSEARLRALTAKLTHAEEAERRRIAQVVHEGLQQLLMGAHLSLSGLEVRTRNQARRGELAKVRTILKEAIGVARSLTYELSPPVLQDLGLPAALAWLSFHFQERFGLSVEVETADGVEVEAEEATVALFQAVRELLFNVVKHAQVKRARVELSQAADGHLQLVVSDAGVGFDPVLVRAREGSVAGFGLFSLRERLERLGGRLDIDSAPRRGSRFTLCLPASAPPPVG
jgi:PAS domain S-box-containing protein